MNIKEKFNALSPKTKKSIVVAIAIFFVILLLILLTKAANVGKKTESKESQKTVSTTSFVDVEDRNTSIKLGVDKKIGNLLDRIEKLEKNKDSDAEAVGIDGIVANDTEKVENSSIPEADRPPLFTNLKDVPQPEIKQAYPPAPQPQYNASASAQQQQNQPIERVVSGIGFVVVSAPVEKQAEQEQKKKKRNWIPSNSIFKATLVTGVYAPTMAAGKQSPYPVVLRLKDLSFFPNEVRKDLSGCFLGGEAYGNLSDERVNIRLNNLSCLSETNQTVIDVPVAGFVQGEDGITGMAGRVVSRQGQVMAAAFVASFLQGMGEAFGLANQTSTVSSLTGSTTTAISGNDIIKYGAGSGFSESFKMLAKYYTDILNDTAPVIEILGGRDVEVIINKGVDINPEVWEWE